MISRIIQFFTAHIWEIRLEDLPFPLPSLLKYLRIILLASRGFLKDHCDKNASVLTYYSMLNVVPLVAVMFAVAKGFGLEKLIEKQVLQLAEKANWQADITNQILTFSHSLLQQAKGGLIAGVGVVLLLWTVISILGKIEETFNDIWEVRKSRTLIRKFSDYLAMMVSAPVLLIVSSSATVLVASQVKVIMQKIALFGIFSSVITSLLNLLPYVSIWALLTMLYLVMPNTRVPVRSGILAGVVAGTIFQIVQWGYIHFQIGVAKYGAIYGSFAAIPLFLAWVQISWMIVLFGAEFAHAFEYFETFGFHPDYSRISVSSRKPLVLRIFHLLTKRFALGEKPLSLKEISTTLEIPVPLARQLLQDLTSVGLVVEAVSAEKSEIAYQPGRTIENITVKEALDEFERHGITKMPEPSSEDAQKIAKYLKEISEAIEKSPANVRLKEI
jgi:membrane protein